MRMTWLVYLRKWCTVGESVMLWEMFFWGTLGCEFHTCILPKHCCRTGMTVALPGGSVLFQQDDDHWHTTHIVQEWFEEHDEKFKVLLRPSNSPDLNPIIHLMWLTNKFDPPLSLQEFKDLLLTWRLGGRDHRTPCRVCANIILGRWSQCSGS